MTTDGSVGVFSDRTAVVVMNKEGQLLQIRILVDGNQRQITLYKTDIQVILGGFILLFLLIFPAPRKQAHGILWTGSKSSLDKLAYST